MSETTNLKLLKHDNVETNTEKFDIENYLNGNWDKIDENVGEVNTNISNINSKNEEQDTNIEQLQENTETSNNKIAKLETELKEMQEDFYQNSIRGQASGEYIHVEDSSNCRARIGISGNSEQETRSGKNKLACPANFEETTLGIKVKQSNGIYSVTGTTTSAGTCMTEKTIDNYTIESGDYLHLNNNVIENRVAFVFIFADGTVDSTSLAEINRICNLENKVGKTISKVRIYCNTKDVNLSFEIKPMICKDSAVTDFEQYGAMPSPDYPSKVVAVGSNVNLIEETFKGYNINASGAFEKLNGFDIQIVKVKANVKYTLNANTNLLGYYNEKPTTSSITYDKSRTILSSLTNVIIPSKTGYIAIRTSNTEKVKIVEGTEIGEYSQCEQGCVKVTECNKNLINLDEVEWGTYYTAIGTLGESVNWGTIKVKALGNTKYYLSGNKVSNNTACIVLLDKNKEFIKLVDGYTNTHLITTTNDTCFLGISISKNDTNTVMLEQNSTETSYEEHQEQSYIMPVQQEMLEGDYFDWDNEEEVHTWNRLGLNGTENDSNFSVESNGEYTAINCLNILENGKKVDEDKILCDKLISKYGDTSNTEHIRNASSNYPNNIVIYIKSSRLEESTVAAFKKYLSTNNITIYYKTETEKRIAFTDEQKSVAKEIQKATSYEDTTHIYSTDEVSPIFDVEAVADIRKLIANISTTEEEEN